MALERVSPTKSVVHCHYISYHHYMTWKYCLCCKNETMQNASSTVVFLCKDINSVDVLSLVVEWQGKGEIEFLLGLQFCTIDNVLFHFIDITTRLLFFFLSILVSGFSQTLLYWKWWDVLSVGLQDKTDWWWLILRFIVVYADPFDSF